MTGGRVPAAGAAAGRRQVRRGSTGRAVVRTNDAVAAAGTILARAVCRSSSRERRAQRRWSSPSRGGSPLAAFTAWQRYPTSARCLRPCKKMQRTPISVAGGLKQARYGIIEGTV